MILYLTYSNMRYAKTNNWPLQGSTVYIHTIADLYVLLESRFKSDRTRGMVVHKVGYEPGWILGFWGGMTEEDAAYLRDDDHCVWPLPAPAAELRWIEIYNGYRE